MGRATLPPRRPILICVCTSAWGLADGVVFYQENQDGVKK
jgi:hypothetical protein